MPYCPNCGNEVSEDADYCTKCRAPLKEGVTYRRVSRRNEKNEKNEKQDDKYGPLVGGLIVTWLGLLLFLQNKNIVTGFDFGGYFLMGLGVIILFRGVLVIRDTGSFDQGFWYLIGGGVAVLIGAGAGISYNVSRGWWAFILMGLGLVIVLRGITERKRNPIP